MGQLYSISINIKNRGLYEKIRKSCYVTRHRISEGYYTDPEKYIDYAYFLGMRNTLMKDKKDTALSNEEFNKLQEILNVKCRCGYIEVGKWDDETYSGWITFQGWNWIPYGVIEYITKKYPNRVYKCHVDYENGSDYCYYKGGVLLKYIESYYDEYEQAYIEEIRIFYEDGSLKTEIINY